MPGGSPPLPTSSPSLIARCWQRARCAGALRIVLSEELRVRHAALSARMRRASSCICCRLGRRGNLGPLWVEGVRGFGTTFRERHPRC